MWSVYAIGKPLAVSASIAKQITALVTQEPDTTVVTGVGTVINSILANMPATSMVEVSAKGGQNTLYFDGKAVDISETISQLSIRPIYGFVE